MWPHKIYLLFMRTLPSLNYCSRHGLENHPGMKLSWTNQQIWHRAIQQLFGRQLHGDVTLCKLKTYNHGQTSWDKFALLALLGTRQTWMQLHLPSLVPPPPIQCWKLLPAICSDFRHCIILFCFLLPRRLTYIFTSRNGTKRLLKEMTGNQNR